MTNVVRFPTVKNTPIELLTDVLADMVAAEQLGKLDEVGVIVMTVRRLPDGSHKYKEAFTSLPGEFLLTAAAILKKRAMALIEEEPA